MPTKDKGACGHGTVPLLCNTSMDNNEAEIPTLGGVAFGGDASDVSSRDTGPAVAPLTGGLVGAKCRSVLIYGVAGICDVGMVH